MAAARLPVKGVIVAESDKLIPRLSKERKLAWTIPWNLIALSVSGDIGDLTIYTDRFGKKVAFPKSPPKKPPSAAQIAQRESFRNAQISWSNLTDPEKDNLEDATKKLSIPMTGQNLWIHTLMTQDDSALRTVEQQSGIELPMPA